MENNCENENKSHPEAKLIQTGNRKIGCWGCLSLFGILMFLTFLALLTAATYSCTRIVSETLNTGNDSQKKMNCEWLQGPEDSKDEIAVIDLHGVIVGQSENTFSENCDASELVKVIREVNSDDAVKAILIRMDTPGGEVTASDVIYHALKSCSKPVVVQMNSMAASGGYYIASAADRIVAHPSTMTGSIGVIIRTVNFRKLTNFIGVEEEIYASGEMKAMLSSMQERTDEEKDLVQKLVNSAYEDFLKVVAEGRNIPFETLRDAPFVDGRILDGRQALAVNLVDRLGYFDDAVEEAEKLAKLKPGSAKIVLFSTDSSFWGELKKLSSCMTAQKNLCSLLPSQNRFTLTPGKAYFLPSSCY